MRNIIYTSVIIFSLVMLPISAFAQVATGGSYTLEQSVIATGGGQNSVGGTYSLDGTIGQAAAGNALEGSSFALTSGFWNFTPSAAVPSFEADVASRPNGNGEIQANDVVQVRRFLNEIDVPSITPNEFQRADSAPRASQGNGIIDSADVVQAIRYLNELDLLQSAAGPSGPAPIAPPDGDRPAADAGQKAAAAAVAPELRVESTSGNAGSQVTVNIRVDAVGNESQYGFAVVAAEPGKLTFTNFAAGNTGATAFSCNATLTPGRTRCDVGNFPNNQTGSSNTAIREINPGDNQILIQIIYTITTGASTGPTALNLASASASDDGANSITLATTNGTVTVLAPLAANTTVSGRVSTADGRGLKNATVLLTDSAGNARSARSSSFGYFRFEDIETGKTYILSVASKRYRFTPQVVTVTDEIASIEFIADP